MSDIIGGDQSPTPEQLRKLRKMLPMLKKQAHDQQVKSGSKLRHRIERMVDPAPCQICAVVVENHGKGKSGFCSSCESNLKAGQTALVTVSGRFAFLEIQRSAPLIELMKKIAVKDGIEGKTARLVQSLGGSLIRVPEEFMDKIQIKFKEN